MYRLPDVGTLQRRCGEYTCHHGQPYTVLEKPLSFKVINEDGQGHVKTLHRNQLLPFFCLTKDMGKAATDGEAEITTESSKEDQVESEAEDNVLYSSSSDSYIDRERSEETVPIHQTAKNSGQGESGLHPRPQQRPPQR